MRKSTAFGLAAVLFGSIVVRLSPLLSYVYWGSDTGEYFSILRNLGRAAHLSTTYYGWGVTYPYFPGMFFVQGAAVGVGDADIATVLNLVIPILGSLAVVPMFLIAIRIQGEELPALFAAAILAGALPHAYTTAHAAPATLGNLLALSGLLLFVRMRYDRRATVPLVLVTGALIATHHLSLYFFVLMVVGAIVLRGLAKPWGGSSGEWREVGYAGILIALTFAYWFGYAEKFRDLILPDVNIEPWWALLVAFPVLLILLATAVYARTAIGWRYRPSVPGFRHSVATYVAAALALAVIGLVAAFASVPGTTFTVPPANLAYFIPLVLLLAFAASGRKFLDFVRDGVAPSAWFLALLGSAVLGIAAAPRVLIPYRHAEYLMVPLAIFAGVGFVRFLDQAPGGQRKPFVFALGAVLLVANAAFAIPPPATLAGWREGTGPLAIDPAYWARDHVSGLVATDHHGSTTVFGFGGVNATWDRARTPFLLGPTGDPFVGLSDINSPSGVKDATYVWIDQDMIAGVRLTPWETAAPMDPSVVAKFQTSPFVKVFDNGYAQLYWIAWGCSVTAC